MCDRPDPNDCHGIRDLWNHENDDDGYDDKADVLGYEAHPRGHNSTLRRWVRRQNESITQQTGQETRDKQMGRVPANTSKCDITG